MVAYLFPETLTVPGLLFASVRRSRIDLNTMQQYQTLHTQLACATVIGFVYDNHQFQILVSLLALTLIHSTVIDLLG